MERIYRRWLHAWRTGRKNNACQVDVNDCLPEHVKKYQDVTPDFNGPNCWNLALVMKGLIPHLRISTASEMSFYMNSDLCRKLSPSENPKPGDIGAIRSNSYCKTSDIGCEVHGFIYVSKNLAYSKNDQFNTSPYALQSLEGVYSEYDVGEWACGPKSRHCAVNDCRSDCPRQSVTFYHCSTFHDFLLENANHIDAEFSVADAAMSALECFTEKSTIGTPTLNKEQSQLILDVGKIVVSAIQQLAGKAMSKEEKFTLEALKQRMQGLNEQFYFLMYKAAARSQVNAIRRGFPMRRLVQEIDGSDVPEFDDGY